MEESTGGGPPQPDGGIARRGQSSSDDSFERVVGTSLGWGAWVTIRSPIVLATVLAISSLVAVGELVWTGSETVMRVLTIGVRVLGGMIVVAAAASRFLDEDASLGTIAYRVVDRLPTLVIFVFLAAIFGVFTGIISGILIAFLGLFALLLIVPVMLYLVIRTALILPAIVVEDAGPVDALELSWAGTIDHSFKILVILLVGSLDVLTRLVAWPATTVGIGAQSLVSMLAWSVTTIALTYFWCLVRRDEVVGEGG